MIEEDERCKNVLNQLNEWYSCYFLMGQENHINMKCTFLVHLPKVTFFISLSSSSSSSFSSFILLLTLYTQNSLSPIFPDTFSLSCVSFFTHLTCYHHHHHHRWIKNDDKDEDKNHIPLNTLKLNETWKIVIETVTIFIFIFILLYNWPIIW